ncbi:hypothetical protein SEA_KEWPIEDOLL_3 [Gordonia phage Kewpiedoll]|nr:hypothetical protein SEA_KEWPIEDOLL_3 [Gordonia phage Kewpiedoll]
MTAHIDIDTTAAYYEAKAIVTAALAGTDRDNRMSAEQVHAITGDLPLTMHAGVIEPMDMIDLTSRNAEVAGDDTRGYYLRRVRNNGRS